MEAIKNSEKVLFSNKTITSKPRIDLILLITFTGGGRQKKTVNT